MYTAPQRTLATIPIRNPSHGSRNLPPLVCRQPFITVTLRRYPHPSISTISFYIHQSNRPRRRSPSPFRRRVLLRSPGGWSGVAFHVTFFVSIGVSSRQMLDFDFDDDTTFAIVTVPNMVRYVAFLHGLQDPSRF